MKKVLLVSYAWPPAGGPGVQRVLKFAKFLPEFGWQPVVLTVESGTYSAIDESLVKEVAASCRVYKARAIEPTFLYKKFVGMKSDERIPIAVLAEPEPGLKKRIANWIRLNLFVPDAKVGWWPGAVWEGIHAIRQEKPSVIFSSAPPPTAHLVAKTLARHFQLPWVADFRDPWIDTHYYESHTRSELTRSLDESLERSVCRAADRVVFVSRLDLEEYCERYVDRKKAVHIANGYDELDFAALPDVPADPDKFTLVHLGGVGIERSPVPLVRAVRRLIDRGEITRGRFQISLVGNVQASVVAAIGELGAQSFVEVVPYVPHQEALRYAARAHALLLLITQSRKNHRILPGKTFEYIRYGKPVVALGPPGGEVDRILRDSGAGTVLSYEDEAAIGAAVLGLYSRWERGELWQMNRTGSIESYSRENLARELASVFDALS